VGDAKAEAEIERIERLFADADFKVEEILEYVDPDDFVSLNINYNISGKKAFEEHLHRALALMPKGTNEILKLKVYASGDHGFAIALHKTMLYDADGNLLFGGHLRNTTCYRKRGGRWFQVSQHASVPFDMQTKAPDLESDW
jgi:ketosteroid isomerase-like protein